MERTVLKGKIPKETDLIDARRESAPKRLAAREKIISGLKERATSIIFETPEQQEGLFDELSLYLGKRADDHASAYSASQVTITNGVLTVRTIIYLDGGKIRGIKRHGGFVNTTVYANATMSDPEDPDVIVEDPDHVIDVSLLYKPKLGKAQLLAKKAERTVRRAMGVDNPNINIHRNVGETIWGIAREEGLEQMGLAPHPTRIGLHILPEALEVKILPPLAA